MTADKNIDVYMYDYTLDGLPEENSKFHFFKLGLAPENNGSLRTLGTLIKDNGHQKNTNMILKMDIEGCEW